MKLSKKIILAGMNVLTAFVISGAVVLATPIVISPYKSTVLYKSSLLAETGTMTGTWKEFSGEVYSTSDCSVRFSSMVSWGTGFHQDVNLTLSIGAEFSKVATDKKTMSCIWKLRLEPTQWTQYSGGSAKGWMWLDM